MGWMYNCSANLWCNALAIWLDRCTSRSGSDLWLDVRDLEFSKILIKIFLIYYNILLVDSLPIRNCKVLFIFIKMIAILNIESKSSLDFLF